MMAKASGIAAVVLVMILSLVLLAPENQDAADSGAVSLRAAADAAAVEPAGSATDSDLRRGENSADGAAPAVGDVGRGTAGIDIAPPAEPAVIGDPALDRALLAADPDHEIPSNPRFQATVRQFQAEADDPLWAQAAEAKIYGEISQVEGLTLGSVDVDCRVTLCRIELTGANFGAPGVAAERLPELLARLDLDTMFMFGLIGANGGLLSVAYLKRKGVTIPQSSSAASRAKTAYFGNTAHDRRGP